MKRQSDSPVAVRGKIEYVEQQHDHLSIYGWVVSPTAGRVDTIEASIAGLQSSEVEITWCASPDVQKVFPDIGGADRARFHIKVPFIRDDQSLSDTLIMLTPIIDGRNGTILLQLHKPSLPLPSDKSISVIGAGDFIIVGLEFLGYFIQYAGLRPSDHILDVGCGIGRVAYPLTYYLLSDGRYEGFDINPMLVQWRADTMSTRFPHFCFRHIPLYNQAYNPSGTIQAADFIFPYADHQFDVVVLTSIFTHMQPVEVRHYLSEIYRVLKPRGRCLCTCFLLNLETADLIERGRSHVPLVHELVDCFTTDPLQPEQAIGFREPLMLNWIAASGLQTRGTYYGSWCGRPSWNSYQDMLVLEKIRT